MPIVAGGSSRIAQVREPRPGPVPPSRGIGGSPPSHSSSANSTGRGSTAPPPPNAPPAGQSLDVPARDERRYVPNEILVTTVAQMSDARLRSFERRRSLTLLTSTRIKLLGVDVRRYRIAANDSVRDAILAMRGDPDVASAQPNFVFELQSDETGQHVVAAKPDTAVAPMPAVHAVIEPAPVQYAIDAMKLDGAHKLATGKGVLIAIIDTGLDETHPEIVGRIADRFDAVGGAFHPRSHGTAMAGVIVAHRSLVGVAPDAHLIAIRAFESASAVSGQGASQGIGQGTGYDIIRSLDFATDHGAQIVNMSFAGPHDDLFAQALAAARGRGIVEIAAAGNAGPGSRPLYPGAEPGVIAITATDTHNRLFAMATRGDYVAAAAPGVDIIAPSTGGGMQLTSGTSVAAAEASGVVALLLQAHPKTSADIVRHVLGDTATHLDEASDQRLDLIDAFAAVQAMSQ